MDPTGVVRGLGDLAADAPEPLVRIQRKGDPAVALPAQRGDTLSKQPLRKIAKRFVLKSRGLVYHSTLRSRETKKRKKLSGHGSYRGLLAT